MSVEKMEKYKEYKKHRKEILRKQKRKEQLTVIAGIAASVVIIGCVGFFIYQDVKPEYTVSSDSIIDWNKYIPDDLFDDEEETTDDSADAASDDTTANSEDTTSGSDSSNQE